MTKRLSEFLQRAFELDGSHAVDDYSAHFAFLLWSWIDVIRQGKICRR
jgi:hypothetical protein